MKVKFSITKEQFQAAVQAQIADYRVLFGFLDDAIAGVPVDPDRAREAKEALYRQLRTSSEEIDRLIQELQS